MQIIKLLWLFILIDCVINAWTILLKKNISYLWHSLFLLIFSGLLFLLEIDYADLALITVSRGESLLSAAAIAVVLVLFALSIYKMNKEKRS